MRRILALLLALLLCFSLLACNSDGEKNEKTDKKEPQTTVEDTREENPEDAQDTDNPFAEVVCTPLLYKVTDDAGNTAWLFGSIHVGRDSYYPLPDYVLNAFDGSDCLAVEFDLIAYEQDLKAQMMLLQSMVYTDGTTIADHLPEDLYNDAVEVMMDIGIYNALLDYYVPMVWYSFIDSAMYEKLGADSQLGIDRYVLNRAKKADMPILDVESAEFQMEMLLNFSEELQIFLLEQTVMSAKNLDAAKENLDAMMDLWASGDEEAFAEYVAGTGGVTEDQRAFYEEFNKAMIVDRNESMADFVEEALASGDEVFVCVGAAHVVGEGALADLMAQRGYTVERITE